MTPTIGRIVLVKNVPDPRVNNGAIGAPAILTRVWGQTDPGLWTVNLKVLLDGPDTLWLTSVYLADNDEALEEIHRRSTIAFPCHAVWPPRA